MAPVSQLVVGDGRTMLQQQCHAPFPSSPALRAKAGAHVNMTMSLLQSSLRENNNVSAPQPCQGKRIRENIFPAVYAAFFFR
eukprot:9493931-Ditylum_brightwellii.AAC.1